MEKYYKIQLLSLIRNKNITPRMIYSNILSDFEIFCCFFHNFPLEIKDMHKNSINSNFPLFDAKNTKSWLKNHRNYRVNLCSQQEIEPTLDYIFSYYPQLRKDIEIQEIIFNMGLSYSKFEDVEKNINLLWSQLSNNFNPLFKYQIINIDLLDNDKIVEAIIKDPLNYIYLPNNIQKRESIINSFEQSIINKKEFLNTELEKLGKFIDNEYICHKLLDKCPISFFFIHEKFQTIEKFKEIFKKKEIDIFHFFTGQSLKNLCPNLLKNNEFVELILLNFYNYNQHILDIIHIPAENNLQRFEEMLLKPIAHCNKDFKNFLNCININQNPNLLLPMWQKYQLNLKLQDNLTKNHSASSQIKV